MADRPNIELNSGDWEEIPDAAGKTWMIQNTGFVSVRVSATDGPKPTDFATGEIVRPEDWTPEPIAVAAGESLWALGNTQIFLREVI